MARLLMVDALYPDPLFGAGFPRAAQILHFLAEQEDLEIHFLALWQPFSKNLDELASLLPKKVTTTFNVNEENFERVLSKELKYANAIWVSRFPIFSQIIRLREKNPNLFVDVKILYDSECIEALRFRLRAELMGSSLSGIELKQSLEDEMRIARMADCVIAVNNHEREIFQQHGCKSVHVITHQVELATNLRSAEGRAGLLFVGRLKDKGSPNLDSIDWFSKNCYPTLRDEGVTVRLVGAISEILALNLKEQGFEVSGQIDDLQPAFDRARLFIAPTRFAAGIPIKVLVAAAAGIPVLATRLLCNQLGWEADRDILVADTPDEFLKKTRLALSNDELWLSLQERAYSRVVGENSKSAFQISFTPILDLLKESSRGKPKRNKWAEIPRVLRNVVARLLHR